MEAVVFGPEGSIYEGGRFRFSIYLDECYPMVAPKLTLLTPLYHPQVADPLNPVAWTSWSSAFTIEYMLLRFYEELKCYDTVNLECCEPSPAVDLLIAGKKEEFENAARLWTQTYA